MQTGATTGAGPCLLAHGGAWAIPDEALADHHDGLREALAKGSTLLHEGASALEAVTEVVASMEAHGAFDAGRGAMLNQNGVAELDAGVMDGATLAFGAVAAVQRVAQPARLARRLLERGEGQARLLVGTGAERFAQAQGMPLVENDFLICARERRRYEELRQAARFHTSHPFLETLNKAPQGTVGCLARDCVGRLAAATSTGGTPFHPPGRVGDSPLPGCGFYATAEAAASATGWGEAIATVLLCGRAVDGVAAGVAPEAVVRDRLQHLHESVFDQEGAGATAGLLLLRRDGHGAWGFTTPRMARGGWHAGGEIWTRV